MSSSVYRLCRCPGPGAAMREDPDIYSYQQQVRVAVYAVRKMPQSFCDLKQDGSVTDLLTNWLLNKEYECGYNEMLALYK